MPESNSPQWRNRITNYGVKPAKEFLAHPLNYRRHPLSQREAFRGAAREIGLIAPVLENSRTGRMIDGHLRVEEAFAIDPDMPIPYVSLDLAPEEEPLALATFDALGAMAVADKELLDALLKEARTEDAALQAMLADLAKENGLGEKPKAEDPGPQSDKGAALAEQYGTAVGQIWGLGQHRLAIGDCRDRAVIEALMLREKAAIVSDPPYGIEVDTSWLSALHVERGKPRNKNDDKLANDDGSLDLSWIYEYTEWLVFGFPFVARDADYTGLLIWDKRGDGGENGLGNPVEVAASNAFKGYRLARHLWAGYVREAGEKRVSHPTQKPVGIIVDAVNLVKNQIILDPFSGSGTTIIACERLGRKCRGIELSPEYAAVAIKRWEDLTGENPVCVSGQ